MCADHVTPVVSVLMPVYNCEPFLNRAIASIRDQSFSLFEFVIVNDGSTDDSLATILRHATEDSRIVVVNQQNGGIVNALNAGLAACHGQYIARMDGDDVAEPHRLAMQVTYLDARSEVGAVGGWADIIDESGNFTGRLELPLSPDDLDGMLATGRYPILHPTLMVRADCLKRAGCYDPSFRYAEDLDLMLRLQEVTQLANIPQTLLKYRRRSASMSDEGAGKYPEWDMKALLAARRRGRRKIAGKTLARAAERMSWTALDRLDYRDGFRQAFLAFCLAPLSISGVRAIGRIGLRLIGFGMPRISSQGR